MSADTVSKSLTAFVQRALALRDKDWFEAPHDDAWRSECELASPAAEGMVAWHPVPQSTPVDFSGLANALEQPIHEDIRAWYGTFWSGSFEARTQEGHVSLIQLWNEEDFDRLIENLLGHALMKKRARQPFTVFFANTEIDSDLFLSVDNESGKVLLEQPGKAPLKVVENDLATFIDRLEPLDVAPGIY